MKFASHSIKKNRKCFNINDEKSSYQSGTDNKISHLFVNVLCCVHCAYDPLTSVSGIAAVVNIQSGRLFTIHSQKYKKSI